MANTVIQIKRSSSTATPTDGSLSAGELAYSYSSDKLFLGTANGAKVMEVGGRYWLDTITRAYDTANAGGGSGNASYVVANMAFYHANAAFDKANAANVLAYNALPKTGGIITGDLDVTGNLTITGNVTFINTQTLEVGDNLIVLNADLDQSTTPTQDAGVEVNRGSQANVSVKWNETSQTWTLTNDGVSWYDIAVNTDITSVGHAANSWANTIGAASNTYADAVVLAMGIAGNNYANAVGTAGNNYTNAVGTAGNNYTNSVGLAGNNYTNSVGLAGNNYTNSVGTAGNNYTNAVGVAGNNYTIEVGAASNTWANTIGTAGNNYTDAVGIAGNNYINAVGVAGNNYTNAVGVAGNNYAIQIGAASNTWANTIGTAGNNYTNSVGAAANNYANNTFYPKTGGTITGEVTITGNLSITNDFHVGGNVTFTNTQTLEVGDPLIYLAANNYTSDLVDIGFVANYNNGSANLHTGLYREHITKEYFLFQGYTEEPDPNHIDPSANGFQLAVLNADLITSNLVLGGANAINWITSAFDKANSANVLAYNTGIGANAHADAVGVSANLYTDSVGVAGNNYTDAVGLAGNNYTNFVGGLANTNAANASYINTGTLAVLYGGTGLSSATANGILYGDGTNALKVTSAGSDGQVLQSDQGVPKFAMLDGGSF